MREDELSFILEKRLEIINLVLLPSEFQKHTKLLYIGRVIKPPLLTRYQVSNILKYLT